MKSNTAPSLAFQDLRAYGSGSLGPGPWKLRGLGNRRAGGVGQVRAGWWGHDARWSSSVQQSSNNIRPEFKYIDSSSAIVPKSISGANTLAYLSGA
jgi:hypothetical protein